MQRVLRIPFDDRLVVSEVSRLHRPAGGGERALSLHATRDSLPSLLPPRSFSSVQVETIYLINPAMCDSTLVKAAVTFRFVSSLVAHVPPP